MFEFIEGAPKFICLLWSICVIACLVLVCFWIFLWLEDYRYPVCPECNNNSKTKRWKGGAYCEIHGFF